MAHRFGPAQGNADNKLGLRGRCQRLAPCARLSIMARSRALHTRGRRYDCSRIRAQPPKRGSPRRSARRIRL